MTIQNSTPKRKLRFMKFFTTDWRDGTRGMSYELKGFYFDILTLLHEGEELSADPERLKVTLQCNPRTIKKLLPKLLHMKKLYVHDGKICNARVDRDSDHSTRIEPEFDVNSDPIQREFNANSARINPKRVSEQRVNPSGISRSQKPESRNQKKVSSPSAPLSDSAVRAGGLENENFEIEGLNGSTSAIVRQFANWLNPHPPDLEFAKKTVADAVGIYGDVAVRDGVAEYQADIADGKVRIPSVKAIYGYIRRVKDRGRRQSGGTHNLDMDAINAEAVRLANRQLEAVQ